MTFFIIIACFLTMAGPALSSSPQLYVADFSRENIYRMPAAGGPHFPVRESESFDMPYAIAYDPVRQTVFWTDVTWNTPSARGIGRLSPNTTTTFYHTGIFSYGLAVESSTGILFVPDYYGGTIKALDFDKHLWRTIVRDVSYRAVVVDTSSRLLYWSAESGRIERSTMAGGSRTTLVSSGLSSPYGLALDAPGGRLFFCDYNLHFADSISLDGWNRTRHVSGSSLYSFCGIALDEAYLYLTAYKQSQILRVNKRSVGATTLEGIGQNGSYMAGLVLTGSSYQQPGVMTNKKVLVVVFLWEVKERNIKHLLRTDWRG